MNLESLGTGFSVGRPHMRSEIHYFALGITVVLFLVMNFLMYQIELTSNPIYIALLFALLAAVMGVAIFFLTFGKVKKPKVKL
jgi:lysylphosphatidylglycerol synthetase-like protein (DUF2156 family)